MLGVALTHAAQPLHPSFLVPALLAVVPVIVVVLMWIFARGATAQRPTGAERASWFELVVAAAAVTAAAAWVINWTRQARDDLNRLDAMLGQATIIIDVSLTWWALGACLAALALDGMLSVTHERTREAMQWLRRAHIGVSIVHLGALVASAWVLTQGGARTTSEGTAIFDRVRAVVHVYEYARATVFPVQAFFAALAVAFVAADSRSTPGASQFDTSTLS
jgi:hypothetical protein